MNVKGFLFQRINFTPDLPRDEMFTLIYVSLNQSSFGIVQKICFISHMDNKIQFYSSIVNTHLSKLCLFSQ